MLCIDFYWSLSNELWNLDISDFVAFDNMKLITNEFLNFKKFGLNFYFEHVELVTLFKMSDVDCTNTCY